MRSRWLAAFLLAVAAVALAACGSSTTSSTPAKSAPATTGGATPSPTASSTTTGGTGKAAGIKTTNSSVGTILETSSGMAIYWFAIDTPTKSNCTGTCLTFWPPVTGNPSLASGVSLPGKLSTITGSNGQTQAVYMGHPLYTYAADTPGKVTGNGLNLSGGLWYAMTPSGAKPSTSSPASSGGGGGGY